MSMSSLSPKQLRQAADLQEKIDRLQTELATIFGEKAKSKPTAASTAKPAKKKISAAGIARIKAAQKARWAKINATKGKTVAPKAAEPVITTDAVAKAAKKKFTMSAAAKAKISAAAKARWAKVKDAKKA